ncbi:MAG: preprotein translocase subunit YajC [Prevotella sp.]|nr:preprotein translocase subunit YajC [Prevotella sp.]
MNISLVLAAQAAGGGTGLEFIIMMVLLFAVMWFIILRPQQKKQKQIREFQNSLKKGDNVVTGGGIYGTVKDIDIQTGKVKVSIARDVVIEVDKSFLFDDTSAAVMQPQQK